MIQCFAVCSNNSFYIMHDEAEALRAAEANGAKVIPAFNVRQNVVDIPLNRVIGRIGLDWIVRRDKN